ncbi:LysR substrate-binding domain-containing protein [Bordetella genomosp. 13]|uniref:LysR substrate-binding domain-containing protein n=1 Tax=Bordetella genomosp. 13 TaxID=463040 RepID=UPI0011A606F9|nr:LysR substrate-binding domain-containing protein [Bordetella genomosp. 13]
MLTNMSRLPLNTLPVFRCVAELQNLRAAATVLHLTHSAVSQQIRTLETQLGFQLFDRLGRGVVLNAAGQALLRSVGPALAMLEDGMHAATAAANGEQQRLRVTVLPSFAQRWLLPRMGSWRARHPHLALEIEASQNLVDLPRAGLHAALRYGRGPWPGLESEPLLEAPLSWAVVGSPAAAQRLRNASPQDLTREPLLGDRDAWQAWFQTAGVHTRVTPVAVFNDAGLLLQAAEQELGLALTRELLAADALADRRLERISPLSIAYEDTQTYHLAYRPELRDWPPLLALRAWLRDELRAAQARVTRDEPAA